MSLSPSGLNTSQKMEPSGPPFPVTSAINGLSVSAGGKIVLGNDTGLSTAALSSDRQIPLNGHIVIFGDNLPSNAVIISDSPTGAVLNVIAENTNAHIVAGTTASQRSLNLDPPGFAYGMGDLDNAWNGSSFSIDDLFQVAQILLGGNFYFRMDAINGSYDFGDFGFSANGTCLEIDDAVRRVTINAATVQPMLDLDYTGDNYSLGNVTNTKSGVALQITGGSSQFVVRKIAYEGLNLDFVNKRFKLGDSALSGNRTLFTVDDTAKSMTASTNGTLLFNLNTSQFSENGSHLRVSAINGDLQLFTTGAGTNLQVFNGAGSNGIGIDSVSRQITTLDNASTIVIVPSAAEKLGVGMVPTEKLEVNGFIKSAAPGGAAAGWKMGTVTAGAVALDAANYVEINIAGVGVVKLLKAV